MAKKPSSRSGKASKPEVLPLGDHLAALLNPALVGRRQGLEEAASPFLPAQLDAEEAARYGLGQEPEITREKPGRRPPPREEFVSSAATAEVLQELLEKGDPRFRETQPWTPHRPARPEKSEGGVSFELVSEYCAAGRPTARH